MASKKGERYKCEECGMVVVVEEECGCEDCAIVCCERPMKKEE
ncbi:desulfoferrodoxin [Methanobacterium oryzae]